MQNCAPVADIVTLPKSCFAAQHTCWQHGLYETPHDLILTLCQSGPSLSACYQSLQSHNPAKPLCNPAEPLCNPAEPLCNPADPGQRWRVSAGDGPQWGRQDLSPACHCRIVVDGVGQHHKVSYGRSTSFYDLDPGCVVKFCNL